MKPQVLLRTRRGSIVRITLILAWTIAMRPTQVRGQDPPPAPTPVADGAGGQGALGGDQAASQDPQVLTRGPVHEAFASPVVHDPAPGPVVPKDPPAPIQEMPPDQKPAGSEYPVDSGLLGLGRLAQRLYLDQRHLARASSEQPVGPGLLEPGQQRTPVGARDLDSDSR